MSIERRASRKRRKRTLVHRLVIWTLAFLIIAGLAAAFWLFQSILKPNIRTQDGSPVSVFIPTGSTFEDVKRILYNQGLIMNRHSFEWVADRKNYKGQVKPGHYILDQSMNNNELVNMLRAGLQTPVRVVINNVRGKEDLAAKVSLQIEADSASLLKCWNHDSLLASFHTTPDDIFAQFIPNTYEMWWTTTACRFTERMLKENELFWNEERAEKAASARMGVPVNQLAMVGDQLDTDMTMAKELGLMGILVLSGETKEAQLANSELQPDLVVSGIGELHTLLRV